jgi:hypothetical protein
MDDYRSIIFCGNLAKNEPPNLLESSLLKSINPALAWKLPNKRRYFLGKELCELFLS